MASPGKLRLSILPSAMEPLRHTSLARLGVTHMGSDSPLSADDPHRGDFTALTATKMPT